MTILRGMLRATALLLLAGGLCLAGRALAQDSQGENANTDTTPGFSPIEVTAKVVDRDGRPIGPQRGLVAVRIDPNWVKGEETGSGPDSTGAASAGQGIGGQGAGGGMILPDQLVVNRDLALPRDDQAFVTRFDTDVNSTIRMWLLQPHNEVFDRIRYEYRFVDAKNRLRKGYGAGYFSISVDGNNTLPRPLRVPWAKPHAQPEWLLALLVVIALVGFITFGIYRPFYSWRLGASNAAAKSRDWAISLWLFLVAVVWGGFLIIWAPRDLPFLAILVALGLMWLLHLVFSALRPREEGA